MFVPNIPAASYLSKRLILRQWQDSDFHAFAQINADKRVMEYYPRTLTTAESNQMASNLQDLISKRGWGFWVAELKHNRQFLGFVGLQIPTYPIPVSPCIEIGWRLDYSHWGNGYATEAANICLYIAFKLLSVDTVYSYTASINKRSEAVMKRLNMSNCNLNFNHPAIADKHRLQEHVLYKINAYDWPNTK